MKWGTGGLKVLPTFVRKILILLKGDIIYAKNDYKWVINLWMITSHNHVIIQMCDGFDDHSICMHILSYHWPFSSFDKTMYSDEIIR